MRDHPRKKSWPALLFGSDNIKSVDRIILGQMLHKIGAHEAMDSGDQDINIIID